MSTILAVLPVVAALPDISRVLSWPVFLQASLYTFAKSHSLNNIIQKQIINERNK